MCAWVWLSASISLETLDLSLRHFVCSSLVVVARSSSGGVAIRYVLPVLWMTSRLAVKDATPKRGGCTVQRRPCSACTCYCLVFRAEEGHGQVAAARLVTGTWKYERGLSRLMHDDLHWLVIPQRVQYKLYVTVHCCLRHRAPRYLADYCVPVSEVACDLPYVNQSINQSVKF